MLKSILKTVLILSVFSVNYLSSFKFNREICAQDLHIFNILNNAKIVLMEDLAVADLAVADLAGISAVDSKTQRALTKRSLELKTLDLIEKEIGLLQEIVQGLNKGLLLRVEYKFISVCNFFDNIDVIEPHDVRAFNRKVIKFDDFIRNYKLKKNAILDQDEIELCEKILIFDEILLTCCLRPDFYNIDTLDKITDFCFFKPIELMGEHPLITASVAAVIFSVAFYFYVLPQFNKFNKYNKNALDEDNSPLVEVDEDVALDEKHPTVENKNEHIDVAQIKVFRQKGMTCGANAAFRLIAFHESHGDVATAYRIANDAKRFNECCRHWAEITKVSSLNDLHTGHLDIIIKDYNAKHADNPIPEDDLTMVDDSKGARDPSTGKFAEFYGIDDSEDALGIVPGKRSRLKSGHEQYVIINTAENDIPGFGDPKDSAKSEIQKDGNDGKIPTEKTWFWRVVESVFGKNKLASDSTPAGSSGDSVKKTPDKKKAPWVNASYGHWLSLMFFNDPSAKDGVRVIMADSIGNPNRTNDAILNGLHRMLVHGS